MFRKIITYFLILAVVLPVLAGAVPLPAGEGVTVVHAEENEDGITRTTTTKKGDTTTTVTEKTSNQGRVNDPCDLWTIAGNGTVMECLSNTIMNFFYDYVLQGAIVIAGLAGELFNASIQFSLTGKVFDADKNTMIKDGWTLVRDLLNLIFIFILLFAAISTILQYGGFEIKKILPSLIVVALLVNFSMMIAKMVIDASHIFAWEFYNQIDVKNEEGLGDGETVANMKNSIEVYGDFEKKNLANVFIAGFNPQDFLTGSDKGDGKKSQWKEALDDSIAKGGTYTSTFWQMTLILLLESVLAIFAGFILLAGAIMFIVRVVVLWLVMIFSPIAFLGMILPSMGKYSKMWWDYLIGQSFFAPAFLFMFMLVTKFINSDFIESIFNTSSNSDLKIVLGLNGGAIVLTFFHFFVVGGLMMACLIVARQLGGKTAEFGIKWAHKGKDLALGGALKYIPKPLLRHTVGSVSSGIAKSEWAERMAARSPVIGGWMKGVLKKGGDVGGFDKIMEQRIKTGQGLSTPELRAQYLSNLSAREQAEWYKGSSARTRVELEDAALKGRHVTALNNMIDVHKKLSLEEQEKTIKARAEVDLKKTDDQLADIFLNRSEEIQKEIINQIKDARKAGFINKLYALRGGTPEFAMATVSTTPTGNNIRKFRPDLAGSRADIISAVGTHKPEDIQYLNKDIVDPANINSISVTDGMINNYKGGHAQKVYERGDEIYTAFMNKLKSIDPVHKSAATIATELQRRGNNSLASWLLSNKNAQNFFGLNP